VGLTAAVLGILGLGVGRLLPDARCSEPKCGQPLAKDATVCPRCGGTVSGVIHHPRERLAAEEALAREAEGDDASSPRA
jgi:predicted amidophosphoribosyltransferase